MQLEAFHNRTERFACIVAHRRFGKTVLAAAIHWLGDKPLFWRVPSALMGAFGLFVKNGQANLAADAVARLSGRARKAVTSFHIVAPAAIAALESSAAAVFGADPARVVALPGRFELDAVSGQAGRHGGAGRRTAVAHFL